MRLYTFVNGLYMRPIQFGIQSAHLLGDMMVKYRPLQIVDGELDAVKISDQYIQLNEWAEHHKTMVILNAVNVAGLQEIFTFLDSEDNPFPYGKFHEDEQSLGGVITCAGVIVPETLYTAAADMRYNRNAEYDPTTGTLKVVQRDDQTRYSWNEHKLSQFEMSLAQKINDYGLAS